MEEGNPIAWLWRLVKPVRTLFGFYIIMYAIPLFPFWVMLKKSIPFLFDSNTHQINISALLTTGGCSIAILLWTLFYLLFFTRERTKNPQLYAKGFVKDFKVRSKVK